jgi:hypothetical protein
MENNNEKELEKFFIEHYAATMSSDDDMGEVGAGKVSEDDMKAAGDILSQVSSDGEDAPAGEETKEADEEGLFDKKPDAALEEIEASKDVIPWMKFKIILDPRYLEEVKQSYAGQLDDEEIQKKAEAQSYYIRCAEGNKRVEGIWNRKLIGGYGTKEKLGDDLQWMKKMTVDEGAAPDSSPGFPRAEVKDILKDMEEPVTVTEKTKKNVEQEQEVEQPDEALESEKAAESVAANMAATAPNSPSIPEPVGQASQSEMSMAASIKEIQKRRILRAKLIKNL